jgi:hypothetical protein
MKKHVIIATGAALLSTSAFATKARMTALGQDANRGSQYVQDSRNVFRNAANVNSMNNYVVTEWGNATDAEGGFFRSTGSLAYGLYMGSARPTGLQAFDTTANPITTDVDAYNPGNQLDLFLAGDAGFQWGVRLNYQGGTDENPDSTTVADENKRSAFGLGLGATFGDLSVYTNLSLSAKAEEIREGAGNNKEVKGKLGLNLGAAYNWQNLTFHADFASNKAERTLQDNVTTGEYAYTDITVGVAQTHEISSTAMVFMALDYSNTKWENNNLTINTAANLQAPAPNSGAELSRSRARATIGFETDATSWLTWRGSVAQNILIGSTELDITPANVNVNGKKQVIEDSTTVAAGASLTFGKLVVDGTLGSVVGGTLNANNFFSNVAVSYWF